MGGPLSTHDVTPIVVRRKLRGGREWGVPDIIECE